MEEEFYDCYNWLIKTENFHMRKNDILNMQEGEKIDVLLLDRDVFENIGLDIPLYHKYRANVFFKDNKATFVKGNTGLNGTLHFTNYNLRKRVELHIEYKKNVFHEIIDGKLKPCQCLNHEGDENFDLEKDNYRVGWKGPMIPWKHINELPHIYLADIKDYKQKNIEENIIDKTNFLTENTFSLNMNPGESTPFKLDV
jgi:hypothetical protein